MVFENRTYVPVEFAQAGAIPQFPDYFWVSNRQHPVFQELV